ncbi:hypothetical protein [Streptomyces sp. NPDC014734]|uniref:hypothetical protein n=1 Tax=Streptomyces sp. NPDC014734 TaxID=3364886 RepID=UPI0037019EB3
MFALPTVVAAATLTLVLWPGDDERPTRSLCFGTLSETTAELIDDGKGGEISSQEWERKGKGDLTVMKTCVLSRGNPDSTTKRGVYSLIIEDTRIDGGQAKGAVPLGNGMTGWATATEAVARLPAACARSMGSTAPYITVTLSKSSGVEKHGAEDQDRAVRDSATVVRESAANLARAESC